MTLIISGANATLAFMMADRRLTRGDGSVDDESGKIVIARFAAARFIVGFTGLAEVAGLPTSEWLAQSAADIGQRINAPALVLEALAERLTSDIRRARVHPRWSRLSIVAIGFIDAEPTPIPAGWRLSNFQHHDDPPLALAEPRIALERYEAIAKGGVRMPIHWFDGSGSGFLVHVRGEAQAYVDGIHAGAHPSILAYHAHRIVTGLSQHDPYVGAHANAAYMTPEGQTRYRYFPTQPTPGTLLPVIVDLAGPLGPRLEYYGDVRLFGRFAGVGDFRFTMQPDPSLYSDHPTEFPVQAKASLCACGSGRKSRNCHRRRTLNWRDVPVRLDVMVVPER